MAGWVGDVWGVCVGVGDVADRLVGVDRGGGVRGGVDAAEWSAVAVLFVCGDRGAVCGGASPGEYCAAAGGYGATYRREGGGNGFGAGFGADRGDTAGAAGFLGCAAFRV